MFCMHSLFDIAAIFAAIFAVFMISFETTKTEIAQKIGVEQDEFGNQRLLCAEATRAEDILPHLLGKKSKKADILVGCRESEARKLKATFAGPRKTDRQNVFLLRNEASCPFVTRGKVR